MRRRFYNPAETEAMVQVAREKEGFTGKTEKFAMANIIGTAKRNGRIGDKTLVVVPPMYIHIPKWQRKLDMYKAEKIGLHYDKNKWEVPKVILNNGILECVDGMHRIIGAYIGNVEGVVVEILDITEKEAIDLFLNQTNDRSQMKPYDYLNASLEIEKAEYVSFKNICHKYNVQIKGDESLKNPVGEFTALTEGVGICRKNPNTLDSILNLICMLKWNKIDSNKGNAFGAKYIRILKKLYAYYEDHSKVERILLENCSGAEWFNRNAEEMTQNQLFDYLSTLIVKNMTVTDMTKVLKAV